jgi:hypothetical protein
MQHWFAVHKFECHRLKPGSPESLDADGQTVSSEVVLSSGSSGSENHKDFATSSVNGVGPPVPMSNLGHTIPSRLPSSIVLSDGQQSKPKKVRRNMQVHHTVLFCLSAQSILFWIALMVWSDIWGLT